jgi:hypothetical protein
MRESFIEGKAKKAIEALGGICIKFTSPGSMDGVPDRIVILPEGRVYFVELKSPVGKLSAIQRYVQLKLFPKLGVVVHHISTLEELAAFIKKIKE